MPLGPLAPFLELASLDGALLLLVGLLGWVAALAAAGLALGRRPRPALVLSGLVVGLGLACLCWGLRSRADDLSRVAEAGSHAQDVRQDLRLASAMREAQAVVVLGALAGLPLLLAGAGVGGLVFARARSQS